MALDDIEIQGGPAPFSLEELKSRIRLHLCSTSAEKALLFGSYARGVADAYSDIDLVVIEETNRPFVERGLSHLPLFRLGPGIDLLVYTPEEFERMRKGGNSLIAQIEMEGITIYEKNSE